jgi:hypothetical protein
LLTHKIHRKLLIPDIINMHGNNVRADSCFQKAVEYQLKNPNLTICDAMKLANFSLREQEENACLDGFLVVFTVVRPLVWLLDPPFFTSDTGNPSCIYIFIQFTLSNEVNLVSMHHLSSTRPSPSDSISTFSAHVLLSLDHHVANKSRSTLS